MKLALMVVSGTSMSSLVPCDVEHTAELEFESQVRRPVVGDRSADPEAAAEIAEAADLAEIV